MCHLWKPFFPQVQLYQIAEIPCAAVYLGNGMPVLAGAVWYQSDTENRPPCASWGQTRVQRVCQFLLIVPLANCHTVPQIPCGAVDLADSGTPEPAVRVWYVQRVSPIVMGSPAPHVMGVIANTLRATLRDLAESDARLYRGLATELTDSSSRQLQHSAIAGDGEIAAAIALLEQHGYTVTR